ncbi:MAG: polyphosphate--nucleotide phosphotransferase [Bacteroidetes bacterium]|nr:MAG: polyphosphate--nucleotide phosphotransferase [Bacteroidota bacterium]
MAFDFQSYIKKMKIKPSTRVSLKKFRTDFKDIKLSKSVGATILQDGIKKLARLQDKLYAHDEYSVLIVLQAMDAAGKDSVIKHVMSGLNPQGVKVTSFKVPTSAELDHDFFWRHYIALPSRGEIGIFNRSHYENVLVTKIHPEFILSEKLPKIKTLKDINDKFWEERYKQINRFEKNLAENGTIILKFFLHLSKGEQKKRFIERIDDPSKNWKFSMGDLKERERWDDYQEAYEQMITKTSTEYAPWYIVPADDKWFTRVAIAGIIDMEFQKLNFTYPEVTREQKAELLNAKRTLEREK